MQIEINFDIRTAHDSDAKKCAQFIANYRDIRIPESIADAVSSILPCDRQKPSPSTSFFLFFIL